MVTKTILMAVTNQWSWKNNILYKGIYLLNRINSVEILEIKDVI